MKSSRAEGFVASGGVSVPIGGRSLPDSLDGREFGSALNRLQKSQSQEMSFQIRQRLRRRWPGLRCAAMSSVDVVFAVSAW